MPMTPTVTSTRGWPTRSGYDRPVVLRGMGEQTLHEEDIIVRTTHSACVLSEEVLDKSRYSVREFYGDAAEKPQEELCCPVQPSAEDLAHIPSEVVERFYGCGSPVAAAALVPGESMVDLGSGAGIDCFIAAKKVGAEGRIYGVDMTDQMLSVARECQPQVAAALGYDVVDVVQSYYHDGEAAYLMQADVKKLAAADAAEDASEEAVLAA